MASIRKIKNREGKVYVYLMESFRENGKPKSVAVKNYGLYDTLIEGNLNAYEELREKAKNNEIDYVSKRSQIVQKIDLDEGILDRQLLNYGHLLLEKIYNGLKINIPIEKYSKGFKFQFDLNKILKLLVFQRVMNPGSKLAAVDFQKGLFGEWNISQNQINKSLDHLHLLQEKIQLQLHSSIKKNVGRTGTLVFYDVTNYYFETDYNDEDEVDEDGKVIEQGLRKRGPSKEHRPKPIVQMGLFMDSNGIPISYRLFPGNNTDPITYIPAIEQVKKQFGLDRIITVADKAMNSAKNVTDAYSKGDGWLFSSKIRGKRGIPMDIQNFALEESGWEYNHERTFAKKSAIRKRKLSNGQVVEEKMLITWNEKYANREKIRRDGAVEYAQGLRQPELYRITCKKGGKKYLEQYAYNKETGEKQPLHPFLDIDLELVEYDAQFDGLNVLLTSETKMSDDEMIANYGELWRIEENFKVTKTTLEARPVFVYKPEHIEAHFLSCFVSLVVLRYLQHKLKNEFSPAKIVAALSSAICKQITDEYYDVSASPDLCEFLGAFGVSWDKRNIPHIRIQNLAN